MVAQSLSHRRPIVGPRPHERNVRRNGFSVAGRQIVEHHDPVTIVEKGAHGVTADVARAAGDENTRQLVSYLPIE